MKFLFRGGWHFNRASKAFLPALLSLAGALVALYPANPQNTPIPNRDSGVFLYVGWRLLHSEIPYRDVWDHKPPLIYFTDAIGLLLSPDSMWGVWAVQVLFVALTIYFLYKALHENLGAIPAIFGTVILSSGLLAVIKQGNVTEEYALPFQAVCFFLAARAHKKNFPISHTLWIGIAGGIAFYYKQNTIGVWLVYGLILIWRRLVTKNARKLLLDLPALGAGVLTISVALALYFEYHNALPDFWEQAFRYNFVYIRKGSPLKDLITLLLKGFSYLSLGNVIYFAGIGWLAAFVLAWKQRKSWFQKLNPLIFIVLIDFPVEVLMIAISGRSILHYYLTPLPAMAVLSGVLVYAVIEALYKSWPSATQRFKTGVQVCLLFLLALSQIQQVKDYPAYMEELSYNWYGDILAYVTENTREQDLVLVLGAETTVNFLARRASPTRYVYQFPLQLLGRRTLVEEFFQEILENRPVLIVDTRGYSQLGKRLFAPVQKRSEVTKAAVLYLVENYEPVMQYGDWIIYALRQNP